MGRNECYTWGEMSAIHGEKRVLYMGRNECYTWGEMSAIHGEK